MKARDDIRNHLRRHRLLAGEMTQEALADRAGVTRQTILAIEKGNYSPSVGLALRLAAILGVPVEALFQLEEGSADET
jgi:putative transcriptional regulator